MAPVMIVAPAKNLSFLTISLLKNLSLSGTVTIAREECVNVDPSDADEKSVDELTAGEYGNHHHQGLCGVWTLTNRAEA